MRWRIVLVLTVAIVIAVLAAVVTVSLSPHPWTDGSQHGRWSTVFTGYGTVRGDDSGVDLSPRTAKDASETHAALVITRQGFGDVALSVRLRTEKQLRAGTPHAWEVGWVLWQYANPKRFYAVVLKPTGWEVSKQDTHYPDGQRFLATGGSPTFPVGSWHTVGVVQIGDQIKVSADGRLLVSITDDQSPYLSGAVGLYCEDARVSYRDVQIQPLPTNAQERSDP